MNAALLSYSRHRKSTLSKSSEFTSCDMFADVFRMAEPVLVHKGPKVAKASIDMLLIET